MRDSVFIAVVVVLLAILAVAGYLFVRNETAAEKQTTTAVLSPSENLAIEYNQQHHRPSVKDFIGDLEPGMPLWQYSSSPWNNCLDPNKVYCSAGLTRMPGGCMNVRLYPRCGMSNCNAGCPGACGNCVNGSCR